MCSLGGQRVILADGDENWRKNIKTMLSKVGCLIIGEAADGVTALKIVRNRQPDLVIIDALLPGLEGVEVANILHEDKLAPVVLTAANYQQDLLDKAKNARVHGFLVKPFEENTLIPAVELALTNYQELVRLEREIKNMKEKLESRKVIERAKGILMETMKLNETQAFKKMQKQSMNKRVSMRAVAEAIIMAHSLHKGL